MASKVAAVNTLDFERTKKCFHRRVIVTTPSRAHAGNDPLSFEQLPIGGAGVLHAPIRMMDQSLRWPPMHQRHRQGRFHQLAPKVMGKSPTDDSPTIKIHDHSQVQPSFICLDIGNIADPNLIASAGLSQLRKPIWSYRFIVEAISRLRPITSLLTTAEPELAPDPIDSLSAVVASTVTKLRLQPRRTVSTPTLLVNFTDLLG